MIAVVSLIIILILMLIVTRIATVSLTLTGLSDNVQVQEGGWLAEKELSELELNREGVTVLGIQQADGPYVGVPTGSSWIQSGDTLVLYGNDDSIKNLDNRPAGPAGDQAHADAVRLLNNNDNKKQ